MFGIDNKGRPPASRGATIISGKTFGNACEGVLNKSNNENLSDLFVSMS